MHALPPPLWPHKRLIVVFFHFYQWFAADFSKWFNPKIPWDYHLSWWLQGMRGWVSCTSVFFWHNNKNQSHASFSFRSYTSSHGEPSHMGAHDPLTMLSMLSIHNPWVCHPHSMVCMVQARRRCISNPGPPCPLTSQLLSGRRELNQKVPIGKFTPLPHNTHPSCEHFCQTMSVGLMQSAK